MYFLTIVVIAVGGDARLLDLPSVFLLAYLTPYSSPTY